MKVNYFIGMNDMFMNEREETSGPLLNSEAQWLEEVEITLAGIVSVLIKWLFNIKKCINKLKNRTEIQVSQFAQKSSNGKTIKSSFLV